ncbi:MAG: RsmD family RNA methyltransferase [Polyangia bacterium]
MELFFERLASGGDAVARSGARSIYAPLGAPGDRAFASVRRSGKRLRAEIERVLEPGPGRREPACELFGVCGGCAWLHLDGRVQLAAKRDFLSRATGVDDVEVRPSRRELGYRARARLQFRQRRRGAVLGFHRRRSREVIDARRCPILVSALAERLGDATRDLLGELDGPAEMLVADGDPAPIAAVALDEAPPASFYDAARAAVGESISPGWAGIGVLLDGMALPVAGERRIRVLGGDGQPLWIGAASFGQANPGVNLELAATASEWLEDGGFCSAIELFSGAGNLTVALARHAERYTAVEIDGEAVEAARENLPERGLERVHAVAGDALEKYRELGRGAELVIVDPPRTGCAQLAGELAGAGHEAILYVSCNHRTLGRDLALLARGGYRVRRALGFDMFPQTAYLESLVLLER